MVGRGGALDMGSAPPPLETSCGSAPAHRGVQQHCGYTQLTDLKLVELKTAL